MQPVLSALRCNIPEVGRTPFLTAVAAASYFVGPGRGTNPMKSFIVACVVAIVVAVIGAIGLNSIQEPVDKAYTTNAVRLGA